MFSKGKLQEAGGIRAVVPSSGAAPRRGAPRFDANRAQQVQAFPATQFRREDDGTVVLRNVGSVMGCGAAPCTVRAVTVAIVCCF